MGDQEEAKYPVKEMSELSVGDQPLNDGDDAPSGDAPVRVMRPSKSVGLHKPSSPTRRIERNKSGPQGRVRGIGRNKSGRAPPRRSQSSKIGRPSFNPSDGDITNADQKPKRRGVNRSQSNKVKGTTRAAPARTGSFQRRRVPDRTSSSSSLRRGAKLGNGSSANGTAETDDISVSDSVFTSMSIQTMDSIMVRKKQIPQARGEGGTNKRQLSIVFDESISGIGNGDYSDDDEDGDHDDEGDVYEYEEEMSVFSESWGSSESCEVLSDYEEGEMDGAIVEDDEGEGEQEKSNPKLESEIGCTSAE